MWLKSRGKIGFTCKMFYWENVQLKMNWGKNEFLDNEAQTRAKSKKAVGRQ